MVDGMSIKKCIEFDKTLSRGLGYVDYGNQCDLGDVDEKANESLVFMLGYKSYWKLPVGYFLCRGTKSGILAGLIREAIQRAFEVGVIVRSRYNGWN